MIMGYYDRLLDPFSFFSFVAWPCRNRLYSSINWKFEYWLHFHFAAGDSSLLYFVISWCTCYPAAPWNLALGFRNNLSG